MFHYDEKKFFTQESINTTHCGEKPRYSMPEQVAHTSRELRNTIEHLKMFEETLTDKYNELMQNMSSDNAIFKDLMHKAWQDFIASAQAEINLYETNTDAVIAMFKAAVNNRLETFSKNYSESYADFQLNIDAELKRFEDVINEQFMLYKTNMGSYIDKELQKVVEQDARITDAVAYMKTNLAVSVANMLNDMHDEGTIEGILQSELIETPESYGAIGDGITDDTEAIRQALKSGKVVRFQPKTYCVKANTVKRLVIPDNCFISGNGATLKAINENSENGAVLYMKSAKNIGIENLTIIGDVDVNTNTVEGTYHGIYIHDCENIHIRNVVCKDCFTDGLYIRGNNITVRDSIMEHNGRQGISITNGENIHIENVECNNTFRTAPKSGIDIEPSFTSDLVNDIFLTNIRTNNNEGAGMCIGLRNAYTMKQCNIVVNGFTDNASKACAIEIGEHLANNVINGSITINNVTAMNNPLHAIAIRPRRCTNAPCLTFNNVIIDNANASGDVTNYGSGVYIYGGTTSVPTGNIRFDGVRFFRKEKLTKLFFMGGEMREIYADNCPDVVEDIGHIKFGSYMPNAVQRIKASGVYSITSSYVELSLPEGATGEVVFRKPAIEHKKPITIINTTGQPVPVSFTVPVYGLTANGKTTSKYIGSVATLIQIGTDYYIATGKNGTWEERS